MTDDPDVAAENTIRVLSRLSAQAWAQRPSH